MNGKTVVHIISAIVAAVGGVLAIGNEISAMPGLPGWLTNAWPVVMAFATLIDRVGSALINHLRDADRDNRFPGL